VRLTLPITDPSLSGSSCNSLSADVPIASAPTSGKSLEKPNGTMFRQIKGTDEALRPDQPRLSNDAAIVLGCKPERERSDDDRTSSTPICVVAPVWKQGID
jgi:hypothetical protein